MSPLIMRFQTAQYLTSEQLHELRKTIERAEAREARETEAQSSIVAVHRESAEERRRREFWARVDAAGEKATMRHAGRLKLVRQR